MLGRRSLRVTPHSTPERALRDADPEVGRVSIPVAGWGGAGGLRIFDPLTWEQARQGQQKYIKVKGSKPGLFGARNLRGAWLMVLTDGELDCMLLDQQAADLAGIASLGSASDRISRLDLSIWGKWLLQAAYILVAYDLDTSGEKGLRALTGFTERVLRAPLPELPGVKDITDYHQSGGDLSK